MKNKKISNYFKEGIVCSRGIANNIFKFYVLEILLWLTIPFIIIGTPVRLAYYRNTNNLLNNRGFKIIESFRDSNDANFLKKVMLSSLIQRLFLLGLLLLFALLGSLFYAIAFGLYNTLLKDMSVYYLAYIPIGILACIYFIYLIFIVVPVEQVYIYNKDLNIINGTKYSLTSGQASLRFKLVLSYLIEFVPKGLIIAGIVINAIYIDKALIAVVILLLYLIFMPKLTLINIILRYDLRDNMIYNLDIKNRTSYSNEILGRKGIDVIEVFDYKIKNKSEDPIKEENKEFNQDLAKKETKPQSEFANEKFNEPLINLDVSSNEEIEKKDEIITAKDVIEDNTEEEIIDETSDNLDSGNKNESSESLVSNDILEESSFEEEIDNKNLEDDVSSNEEKNDLDTQKTDSTILEKKVLEDNNSLENVEEIKEEVSKVEEINEEKINDIKELENDVKKETKPRVKKVLVKTNVKEKKEVKKTKVASKSAKPETKMLKEKKVIKKSLKDKE